MKKFVRMAKTELIIIDKATFIRVGASIIHLGKKCFAFPFLDKVSNCSLYRFIGAALPFGWTYFRKQRLVRPPCPFLSSTLMATQWMETRKRKIKTSTREH